MRFSFFQLDISGKLYLAPLTTVGPVWGAPSASACRSQGRESGAPPVTPSHARVPRHRSVGTCPSGGSVSASGPM